VPGRLFFTPCKVVFVIHVLRRSEAEKLSEVQKLRSCKFPDSEESDSEHADSDS
jgi:hypothetical protein